jgi:hypothetical protein
VRLASPIGSAADSSVNLSNVAKLAAHPKFVWVFNANCDGTIIYNDPVQGDSSFTARTINPIKKLVISFKRVQSIFPYHFIQNHKIKKIDFEQKKNFFRARS